MLKQKITNKTDFSCFTLIKLHATVMSVKFCKSVRPFLEEISIAASKLHTPSIRVRPRH